MRYLCCSSKVVTTTAAKYTTNFMKGIQPDLIKQWHQLIVQLGIPAPGADLKHQPWMITSSDQLLPVLRAFRNRGMLWSELVERKMQSAHDFERLYTNLPQQDLTMRLHRIVDDVFAMHPGAVAVIVWKQKGLPLRWLNYVPDRLCDTENGQRFQAFTPDSIKWLLSFLVEQTFVTFTGRLYHQLLGIPMGISPAVFIANFYLHAYEYDFYRQLLPLQAAGVQSPLHVAALRHLMVAGIAPPGGSADVSALVLDSFLYTTRCAHCCCFVAGP